MTIRTCWATKIRAPLQWAVALILTALATAAAAQILSDTPDAIVCSVKDPTGALPWEQLVFYVSARTVDGRTLYKTLTSDPVVLFVEPSGIVDGANLADCDGQTIEQLRQRNRAFSFKRS